jgi:lysophospholipase L1-like esterase
MQPITSWMPVMNYTIVFSIFAGLGICLAIAWNCRGACRRLAVFFACLCLGVPLVVSAADAPGKPPVCRIMPVGDSITEGGKTFANWRPLLLEKLKAAGYQVEYVGSKQSPSPLGPLAHEGYGGKNAEFLAATVGRNFQQHPADIVLLHCGHNHDVAEKPVPGIVAATEKLIASCRAVNPKVTILLAQVITSGKLPKYSYIPELNQELEKLAQRLNTPDQPVILVNQAKGFDFTQDAVADKVHPNASGAEKMAATWFAALEKILKKP